MSRGPLLRALVAERLTAAAEEIFVLIERTVLEYELELGRWKEESGRRERLLEQALGPDVQFQKLSQTTESKSVSQSEIHNISDEEPETEGCDDMSTEPPGAVTVETVTPEEQPVGQPEEQLDEQLLEQPEEELAEQLEEQQKDCQEELETTPNRSIQEMDSEVAAGSDVLPGETNEEPSDVQTPSDAAKPKIPRRRYRRTILKRKHTKRTKTQKCTVCGKVLKGPPINLARHMVIHTGLNPYSCPICQKGFTQRCYLKRHVEDHEKEAERQRAEQERAEQQRSELEMFDCSVCKMKFKRQVVLKKHMESHGVAKDQKDVGVQHEQVKIKVQDEEEENRNVTGQTPEQLAAAELIRNSMKAAASAHAAPGDFGCDICHRTFTTRTRLKRHMTVHTGDKPFSCPVCHKFFSQKHNVRLHMAVHTDARPFWCKICFKGYRRNDDLRTHMAAHAGKILFSCVVCHAGFKQRNCLLSHMRRHTGERPYRCSVCDKSFIQKSNLTRHERSHTGDKPFRCPVCPRRFLQRSDIRKHMSVHT